ncbi:Ctr copper transporter [Chlamydoabsidia padenii]|nr:Ctr copper transporter [Chlamydoabsidia padenii]
MDHSSHGTSGSTGGMDMSMGTFHWSSTGDALWFDSWMPKSEPAYIGACIGLFLFAIVSRGLLGLEIYFVALRGQRFESLHQDGTTSIYQSKSATDYPAELELPLVPPFSWITDIIRSFLTTLSSFISYLLMLVVMTGNGGFFIVIIVGIFIGEIAFGRFRSVGGIKGGGEHDH